MAFDMSCSGSRRGLSRRATIAFAALAACVAFAAGGCQPPQPSPVTIELVNPTTLDVRPNLHVAASAGTPAELFVAANLRTDFTDRAFPELRAGETRSLTIDCGSDAAGAIGVSGSVLFDATSLGTTVSADTIFLKRDLDYSCGDTIRLRFFTEGSAFRVSFVKNP